MPSSSCPCWAQQPPSLVASHEPGSLVVAAVAAAVAAVGWRPSGPAPSGDGTSANEDTWDEDLGLNAIF